MNAVTQLCAALRNRDITADVLFYGNDADRIFARGDIIDIRRARSHHSHMDALVLQVTTYAGQLAYVTTAGGPFLHGQCTLVQKASAISLQRAADEEERTALDEELDRALIGTTPRSAVKARKDISAVDDGEDEEDEEDEGWGTDCMRYHLVATNCDGNEVTFYLSGGGSWYPIDEHTAETYMDSTFTSSKAASKALTAVRKEFSRQLGHASELEHLREWDLLVRDRTPITTLRIVLKSMPVPRPVKAKKDPIQYKGRRPKGKVKKLSAAEKERRDVSIIVRSEIKDYMGKGAAVQNFLNGHAKLGAIFIKDEHKHVPMSREFELGEMLIEALDIEADDSADDGAMILDLTQCREMYFDTFIDHLIVKRQRDALDDEPDSALVGTTPSKATAAARKEKEKPNKKEGGAFDNSASWGFRGRINQRTLDAIKDGDGEENVSIE
jgi:hypothetical protein